MWLNPLFHLGQKVPQRYTKIFFNAYSQHSWCIEKNIARKISLLPGASGPWWLWRRCEEFQFHCRSRGENAGAWDYVASVWVWVASVPGQGVADPAHLRGLAAGLSGLSHALYCRWDTKPLPVSLTSCPPPPPPHAPTRPDFLSRPFFLFLSPLSLLNHLPSLASAQRYFGLHWLMDCSLLPNCLGCGPLRHVLWGTSGNASPRSFSHATSLTNKGHE